MAERGGLISTQELAGLLGQSNLRVFDCTTYLDYQPEGSGVPYLVVPGRQTFEAGHIPGADFLDLQGEFSDSGTELRFMMPGVAQLEAAFARHGVGNAGSLPKRGSRDLCHCARSSQRRSELPLSESCLSAPSAPPSPEGSLPHAPSGTSIERASSPTEPLGAPAGHRPGRCPNRRSPMA